VGVTRAGTRSFGPDVAAPAYPGAEMRERRQLGRPSVAGIGAAGVVLGHWLAYRVAIPEPVLRGEILAATGHAYWLVAVKAAVILGLAGVGSVLVARLSRELRGNAPVHLSFDRLALELAAIQAPAFTAMELVERLASHAPLAGMFLHGVFLIGLLFQLAVAAAGAVILQWLERAADRVCAAVAGWRRPPVNARVLRLFDRAPSRPVAAMAGAAGVRGPPSAHI
jgi:hypothetical protein